VSLTVISGVETQLIISSIQLEDWAKAQVDFFESFKNYDEAGSPQRIQVLKYLVLAHMLMDSTINPFDSQETKPFVLPYPLCDLLHTQLSIP
jgi:hypothetical protein